MTVTPERARQIGLGVGAPSTREERVALGVDIDAAHVTDHRDCPNHAACVAAHFRAIPLQTRAPVNDPDHPYRQAVLARHAANVTPGFTLGEPDGSA